MEFSIDKILYALLTIFIVLNYGLVVQGIMPKITMGKIWARYKELSLSQKGMSYPWNLIDILCFSS